MSPRCVVGTGRSMQVMGTIQNIFLCNRSAAGEVGENMEIGSATKILVQT